MATRRTPRRIYRISFINQGRLYELFARRVASAELMGFVEVEELIFGERAQMVIDPGEERLRHEFEGVRRSLIPMHAVLRIDEVEQEGISKVHPRGEGGDNVSVFPPGGTPPRERR